MIRIGISRFLKIIDHPIGQTGQFSFDLILTYDDPRVELFLMNTVVPSDVDPCLIQLSSISHFERKTRICTSSCEYILNIIILVMSYYLIVTWSSRDQKINWTKIFLTEINQRVRRKIMWHKNVEMLQKLLQN